MPPIRPACMGLMLCQSLAESESSLAQCPSLIQQTAHRYRQLEAPTFEAFIQEHARDYKEGTDEYSRRRDLFERRSKEVQALNARPSRLWTAGINHLSDWTEDELKTLRGWRGHAKRSSQQSHPSGLNLRQSDAEVTEVENFHWNARTLQAAANQGACGSCWAVATSKMMEANYEIYTNQTRSFSAQELVDCTPNPHECGGTGGCEGATVELAMLYVSNKGLSTSESTPYMAFTNSCQDPPGPLSAMQLSKGHGIGFGAGGLITMEELTEPGVKTVDTHHAQRIGLVNWERLSINEEMPLQQALMQGVVAVSVEGGGWSHYSSGIFNDCSQDAVIDHAVVAIGFGKDGNHRYWTILNSWGQSWGEEGKIRLLRPEQQFCGVDNQPELGTGCKGGPASIQVCGMCGVYYDSVIARFGTRPNMLLANKLGPKLDVNTF